jgi:hypothetical protein
MIVKMQLLTPTGGGAKAREMAVLRSRFKIEGFWKIEEPEILRAFEGRAFAFSRLSPLPIRSLRS